MENAIKKDMPEYYKKLKPYIEYLESLGFKSSKVFDKKYFTKGDPENYEYFNTWKYDSQRGDDSWSDKDYVCDLILSTGELKLEIYQYEIVKQEEKRIVDRRKKNKDDEPHLKPFPYIMDVPNYDGEYKSVIVDNLEDFKIQIGNYLKKLKEFKEMKKKYELEADFT